MKQKTQLHAVNKPTGITVEKQNIYIFFSEARTMAPVPKLNKKRKKPKYQWKEEDMVKAIAKVRQGMNPYKASKECGVPRSTLELKLKLKEPIRKRQGPECTIGELNEKMLANWIRAMVERGFPITALDLVNTVKKMVGNMNLKTNFKNSCPGRTWYKLFLRRHKLTMRSAEKLTSSRASVTSEGIRRWFHKVNTYVDLNNLQDALEDPKRLFNMDESGFLLCPKGEKVVAIKGQRNVYQVCSNNEKESITVLLTVSAAGQVGPSLVVYPGQRYPKNLEKFLPDNWAVAKTEKGWITGESFYEYIANSFHPWLLENKIPLPVLLFLDGHSSHLTHHLSEFAAKNGIEIIALHPNATHILQPLDVSVFGPLKKKYAQRVNEWKIENDTLILEKIKLPMMLERILQDDLDKSVIINGFRACGLYPFSASNVDFSKCVTDDQHNEPSKSAPASDNRHDHLERLLGTELVSKFKSGDLDQESSLAYRMWIRSKEICFGSSDNVENLNDLPDPVIPLDFFNINFNSNFDIGEKENVRSASDLPSVSSEKLVEDVGVPEPFHVSSESNALEADLAGHPSVPPENGIPDVGVPEPFHVSSESNALEADLAGHPSVPPENGIPDADVPGTSYVCSLAKVLSPETGGVGVPSPIKRAFHWPGTPNKNKKNVRRCLESGFPAISSKAFREWKSSEKQKKIDKERAKEENKLKREENKRKKEILKQEALKKKEKRRRQESETSNSDVDVSSGESVWNEEESSDENTPKWQLVVRQEGEGVIVRYEGKYYPGEILQVKEEGALVKTMKASGRLWIWPDQQDSLFYVWHDIVSHCTPKKTSKTRNVFAVQQLDFQNSYVH